MPTALELKREGWQSYIEAARQRPAPPPLTRAEQHAREQLLGRVRQAATELRNQFDARRVVLFGSLAHAAWFTLDSDVDLAVEGLTGENYWRAWRVAEDIIGAYPIDFIDIEMASDPLRRAIDRYGMEL